MLIWRKNPPVLEVSAVGIGSHSDPGAVDETWPAASALVVPVLAVEHIRLVVASPSMS